MADTIVTISEPGLHVFHKDGSSSLPDLKGEIVVQMAGGDRHWVLVCESGKVLTYGRNEFGQLGLSTDLKTAVSQPTPVAALSSTPISQVACGYNHTLFLSAEGDLFSCGRNHSGELGHDNKTDGPLPTRVTGVPRITIVAAGGYHSVLVAATGEVWVAGYNHKGQLGLGHTQNQSHFTVVPSVGSPVSKVSCGDSHTALVSNGSLFISGRFKYWKDNVSLRFVRIPLTSPVTAVASGWSHIVVLTANGMISAWGKNYDGQLGIGTKHDSTTPQRMVGLDGVVVKDVIAGCAATFLITIAGDVWTCGSSHLQLQDINNPPIIPIKVTKIKGVLVDHVAMSNCYTLVLVVREPEPSEFVIVQSEICSQTVKDSNEMLPLENTILKALECPVCFKVMCAPIQLCTTGHSVCHTCRSRTTECPTCRQPYSDARNFGLETLGADSRLPCTDCWERLPTNLLEGHGSVCPQRALHCPVTTFCTWTGRSDAMLHHVTSAHPDQVWLDSPHPLTLRDSTGAVQTDVLVAHGRVFLLHCKYDVAARVFHAAVVLVGPPQDCCLYKYHIELINEANDSSLIVRKPLCDNSLNASNIFNSSKFIISKEDQLSEYLNGGNIVCEVSIVKSTLHVNN